MSESLKLTLHSAELEASGGMFSSLNTYVKILYGQDIIKTHTVYEGGSTPKFNKTYDLQEGRKAESILVQVWSEGSFSDSNIGQCRVKMNEFRVNGTRDHTFVLMDSLNKAGSILFTSEYSGPGVTDDEKPTAQPTPAAAP